MAIGDSIRTQDLNTLKLAKGALIRDGDVRTILWDYLEPCTGSKCPYAEFCHYGKKKWNGRCMVKNQYLKCILDPLLEVVRATNSQFIMNQVGTHLLPLYKQLVTLKLEELRIGSNIFYEDKSGKKNTHPVLKEIREVMKSIRQEWKDSGLQKIAEEKGFFDRSGIIPEFEMDPDRVGSALDYEAMTMGSDVKGKGKGKKR